MEGGAERGGAGRSIINIPPRAKNPALALFVEEGKKNKSGKGVFPTCADYFFRLSSEASRLQYLNPSSTKTSSSTPYYTSSSSSYLSSTLYDLLGV